MRQSQAGETFLAWTDTKGPLAAESVTGNSYDLAHVNFDKSERANG
jgi:hypothetical protein